MTFEVEGTIVLILSCNYFCEGGNQGISARYAYLAPTRSARWVMWLSP
jgi:hypothetical protein